jgi:hypothetical protein
MNSYHRDSTCVTTVSYVTIVTMLISVTPVRLCDNSVTTCDNTERHFNK